MLNIRGKALNLEDKVTALEGQCLCLGVDIISWSTALPLLCSSLFGPLLAP